MGNEAIAFGAIRAGAAVCTGYPGTPSTEILETIAKERPKGVYCEWSVNEKSALEIAAGAAMAGARALVTMKQVGLNVAADPLMSLNYVGVKGGLVVVVCDDPGPISSQTEQDTRHFGRFGKFSVFDPVSPEEAYEMTADAFSLSEQIGRPVILRSTTRVCHSYATVELRPNLPRSKPEGFTKDGGRWVIFPKLSYENHLQIENTMDMMSRILSSYPGNRLSGQGSRGVAAGGVSYLYVKEAIEGLGEEAPQVKLLKIGTYPFPANLAVDFLSGLDEVLVCEELDPHIEDELIRLCGRYGIPAVIRGKHSGDMPRAGENSTDAIEKALRSFLGMEEAPAAIESAAAVPPLPVRPPVLCAGCPHRASFFAVKEATRDVRAVYSGDIGCYTLGNALPLDMVDTCLCMGAGITQAQGLFRAEPEVLHIAFIGDSTFFHTGIPGIVNAVYNRNNIVIAILDNATTAMTGGQTHPGMDRTLLGRPAKAVSIRGVAEAIGADDIQTVNAFDLDASKAAVRRAAAGKGVRVIIFEGPCINLVPKGAALSADMDRCMGCGLCVLKLGCPALSQPQGKSGKIALDGILCTGCGLCIQVCPFGALSFPPLSDGAGFGPAEGGDA
ncbi:MAG: indolepyruvate ferredoxin oxidoreductase subunit alpha [Clostridiales Family XIII bacterium]|jgi:indolepyruvate ferredoxin oxidoreductase alpha subunit|nr:indolepyruvate ferredoxin oxidoreductase subunit alpha [Clostridiales Family XIII bacterium]